MKRTKEVVVPAKPAVPAKVAEVFDCVVCDLCGGKIEEEGVFEVNEVAVRYKTGNSYPEGGSGTETGVDMCVKCFNDKLVPWLRSQGAEPRTTEWDW